MSGGKSVCPGRCIPRASIKDKLFAKGILKDKECCITRTNQKVTVIGCGSVGIAAVLAILYQKISNEICIVDPNEKLMEGEALDLLHATPLLDCIIHYCTDYSKCVGSKICVVTAGARQKVGETRLDLIQSNVEILKRIIPNIVNSCPSCIIVIVTNPCDILTYVAWKLSGFPRNRVIGSGTLLDSSRFRFFISEEFNISPSAVDAWIIGEHGDSSVALWSGVSVASVRLRDIEPRVGKFDDPEDWVKQHKRVIDSAYDVIALKGYTNWAIGLCVGRIVDIILQDRKVAVPISSFVNGLFKIEDDVTLALPCVLGADGVLTVLRNIISRDEQEKLKSSAKVIQDVINDIKF